MNQLNIDKLIAESLAMEVTAATDADALGFMARAMVQATMPHRQVDGNEFVRQNGDFSLNMMAPSAIGLPYGSLPRLLLAWLTTEAVRTKERELILGDTLSSFMRELDLVPTGGRWGSITRLKEQTLRLFSSSVSCTYVGDDKSALMGYRLADKAVLWWDSKQPEQAALWKSSVTLTESFFEEITSRPVPVDMRALKALRRSPLGIDVYCWLTYRASYLKQPTVIPWPALAAQFGSDYARPRDFKAAFIRELKKVETVYPGLNVDTADKGLIIKPGRSHIPKLKL